MDHQSVSRFSLELMFSKSHISKGRSIINAINLKDYWKQNARTNRMPVRLNTRSTSGYCRVNPAEWILSNR